MAAAAFTLYSKAVEGITKKTIDLSADTFIIALLTNSYTPAANTHQLWSDVSATELAAGSGYTAGGAVLASVTDVLATATVTFDAADPAWSSFSAGPFRYAVIVRRASGSIASGDLLICYSDLTGSGSLTGAGGTFTITINASGIFTVTHSP